MIIAIARELKSERIRKDLGIEETAKKFGLHAETIRRYEKNASGLTVEKLDDLLNYYGTKRDIFFTNVCANMHENEQKKESEPKGE